MDQLADGSYRGVFPISDLWPSYCLLSCGYHSGNWTLSTDGQPVQYTWYDGARSASPAAVTVEHKNLTIASATASGGVGASGAHWLFDPTPYTPQNPPQLTVTYETDKLRSEFATTTLKVYPSARTDDTPVATVTATSSTDASSQQITWNGMENVQLVEKGIYVFDLSVEAQGSPYEPESGLGDSDDHKSPSTRIASTGAQEVGWDESTQTTTIRFTYRLGDDYGQPASSAEIRVHKPDLTLYGTYPCTGLDPGQDYSVDIPVVADQGGRWYFLLCAMDNHHATDKAHRDRPVLPRAASVTIALVDLDVDGVADADETTKGKFALLNNDDDNANHTPDRDESGSLTGEDDLVKVTLKVEPTSWSGTVSLSGTGMAGKIRVWTTPTKGTEVTLPATYSAAQVPSELWVEGYSTSDGLRDAGLRFTADTTPRADEVKFTVLTVTIAELGFTGDHMISEWPSGTKIDDPDGSLPVWKKVNNPNQPVCYTKNTTVTMFGKFSVAPSLSETLTGVGIRARKDTTVFAQRDNQNVTGSSIDVTQIAGTTALETTVKTTTPSFTWEISLDGGTSWASASSSGPHTMYWTDGTPLESPLYDLALEKACGYVNGDADIYGKINSGMDSELYYDPSADHAHDLSLFSAGTGECCCMAIVFRILARSVGNVDGLATYIWGGCSPSIVDYYKKGTWWGPSFRVLKSAHDAAEQNPHFAYHVETLVGSTYYDPSYGATGLITLDETAPSHYVYPNSYPAASEQTGGSLPGSSHHVDWTCPH